MNEQKVKNLLEEVENELKDIGGETLRFIARHQTEYGKDEEWEIAVDINHRAHKLYDKVHKNLRSI